MTAGISPAMGQALSGITIAAAQASVRSDRLPVFLRLSKILGVQLTDYSRTLSTVSCGRRILSS